MNNENVFICITPVRNEAWILPYFLEINSQWADNIIVVDQQSTDGSVEILEKHPKVTLIKNKKIEYDEAYRSKLLWEGARKINAKKRIVIALDADEYIPPEVIDSDEWKALEQLCEGTRIFMKWIQMQQGLQSCYHIGLGKPFGYVDDGTEISGKIIHSERVPLNPGVKPFFCKEVVNIHLGDVPVIRNYKKHSWYLMYEYLNKKAPALDLNLNYRKAEVANKLLEPVKEEWLPETITTCRFDIIDARYTWWDTEILNYFKEFGEKKFKKLDIWDYNWNSVEPSTENSLNIQDPRSAIDKIIISYTKRIKNRKANIFVRVSNSVIRTFWQ